LTDKNAQLSLTLTNPRDATSCQKLLQFEVKTSSSQVNNLFEVMEIRCLVIKFLILIISTYSRLVRQMTSLNGLGWRSMKRLQQPKIVITGEGYYAPPTLLMEEGT